jgi:MFS superfamily sulfate permease-like transporter
MGYALLANLAPVNGLYMSFFPLLIYALFGTSRHIAMGTIAIVSLMSGEVIETMADQFEKQLMAQNSSSNLTNFADEIYKYKVSVSCSLSLFVGLTQIIMVKFIFKYFHL